MTYKIRVRSKPGMYAQYDFEEAVDAEDSQEALAVAYERVRKVFPDRTRNMWSLEIIGME